VKGKKRRNARRIEKQKDFVHEKKGIQAGRIMTTDGDLQIDEKGDIGTKALAFVSQGLKEERKTASASLEGEK